MRKIVLLSLAVALAALPALAVEVHLRDGTAIQASAYLVTGSYVMLTLADGRQVAYDVADVDLASLREPEAEDASAQSAAENDAPPSLSKGKKLALPSERPSSGGLSITDADVKHVRDQAPEEGGEAEGQTSASEPPSGYSVGGRVVLNNLHLTSQGEDKWLVEGEVVNHGAQPVINVKVQLQTLAQRGQAPWSGEVAVASQLMPGEKGVFSQSFSAPTPPDKAQPDIRASVIWMQRGEASGDKEAAGRSGEPAAGQGRRDRPFQ
jgi:hypothetical protein